MINVSTRCPKCCQCRTLISHYLKPNSPVEVYSLSLLPVFSPMSSFQVRLCSPDLMCQYIPIHASHRAPMQSPLPHHLTLAFSSRLDPRCMAVCIRMLPHRNAFWVSRHLCSLALWFASEVGLCRHRICLCPSSVDMLLRQALPPSVHFSS